MLVLGTVSFTMQILFLQLGKPLAPLGATTFNLQGLEMHQGAVGLEASGGAKYYGTMHRYD